MSSIDAKPFPIKNTAYRITFPILDADGDLVTGAAGLDSEISKDGGTFADCSNEATEIATNSGMYYLDLTATEMNADTVAIIVKTSTADAKTTPIVLYPVENTDIPVNVKAIGDSAQSAIDLKDFADTGYDPSAHRTQAQVKAMDNAVLTAAAIATDAITATKIAADAIGSSEFAQAAADKVWATAARALTDKAGFSLSTAGILAIWHQLTANIVTANTIGKLLKDNIDAAISSRSSHNAAAVWSAGGRELSTPNNYKADVSALALEATLTAMKGATFAEATDSLEAIRNRGDDAWITAAGFSTHAAADIWTAANRELSTPNNYKADISALALETSLNDIKGTGFVKNTHSLPQCLTAAGFSTHAAADIWAVGTRALTDKVGFTLSTAGILAIWHQLLSGIVTADTIGKLLKDNINATISSRSSHSPANIWSAANRELSTPNNYKADVSALALASVCTEARLAHLDADISSRLATSGYTAPDNTNITNIINLLRNGVGYATCPTNKSIWDYLDAVISSRSSHAAADIWTAANRALSTPADYKADVSALALEATLIEMKGAGWSAETLKAIYDAIAALNDPTSATIADAVWDELIAGHLGAGSTGLKLNGASAPTKEEVADQVWDELIAGHLGAGSTGLKLNGASAPTKEEVADQVWDELQSGHTGAGSFGKYLDTPISSVGGVGSGALSCTWTQKDEGDNPMDNVQVWITTDEAGMNVIAGTLLTNSQGKATFMLDAGTYYVWREKGGYNFTNPQTWMVS